MPKPTQVNPSLEFTLKGNGVIAPSKDGHTHIGEQTIVAVGGDIRKSG
jgi:hypothetical protein